MNGNKDNKNSDEKLTNSDLINQLKELREQNLKLTEQLNAVTLKISAEKTPGPSAPSVSQSIDYKYIKELLSEIRDYDGSTHPEPFIKSVRYALSRLRDDYERDSFARKLIAQKIKGPAQAIADRIPSQDLGDVAAALEVSFGTVKLSYEQLSEQRNGTRQGQNEGITNYIKRYEELHIKVQSALDSVPQDYRESLRYMEEKLQVKRFIESLRSEIEIRLIANQPTTLREAFAEAQRVDKRLRDDEVLRRGKPLFPPKIYESKPKPTEQTPQNSQQAKTPLTKEEREKRYYCGHCKAKGHTEARCFDLHPDLKKKNRNFQLIQQDLKPPNECYDEIQPSISETLEQTSITGTW